MADITMCQDAKCPKKDTCYRYNAVANKYNQCYCDFEYGTYNKSGNGCDYYWYREEKK